MQGGFGGQFFGGPAPRQGMITGGGQQQAQRKASTAPQQGMSGGFMGPSGPASQQGMMGAGGNQAAQGSPAPMMPMVGGQPSAEPGFYGQPAGMMQSMSPSMGGFFGGQGGQMAGGQQPTMGQRMQRPGMQGQGMPMSAMSQLAAMMGGFRR